jgi:heptaprenylglyceryl phosphate synthase
MRSAGRRKGKAKKSAVAKKTTVSEAKPSTSAKPPKSKAAFVRGLPASTPAKDVVKQAKAAGIKLGISYVYNIRGAAKMAVKKKRAVAKSPAVSTVVNGGGSRVSASAENLLKAVAAEIGLGRAIELLHGERGWVHSIIRG